MKDIDILIEEMIMFDKGDAKRIQHFIKVYEYAHLIGIKEKLSDKEQKILEAAAVLHDIGIIPSEKKYGSSSGNLQEKEGPAYAETILKRMGSFSDDEIERICYLIAHHHTYNNVDGRDYRILIEADFLVNAYEEAMSEEMIRNISSHIFKTDTGRRLLCLNYGIYLPSKE